jgi:hypothetical protein
MVWQNWLYVLEKVLFVGWLPNLWEMANSLSSRTCGCLELSVREANVLLHVLIWKSEHMWHVHTRALFCSVGTCGTGGPSFHYGCRSSQCIDTVCLLSLKTAVSCALCPPHSNKLNIQRFWLLVMFRNSGLRPEIPENCPKVFRQIMEQCWEMNPRLRPVSPLSLSLSPISWVVGMFVRLLGLVCVCVCVCVCVRMSVRSYVCLTLCKTFEQIRSNLKWFCAQSEPNQKIQKWTVMRSRVLLQQKWQNGKRRHHICLFHPLCNKERKIMYHLYHRHTSFRHNVVWRYRRSSYNYNEQIRENTVRPITSEICTLCSSFVFVFFD